MIKKFSVTQKGVKEVKGNVKGQAWYSCVNPSNEDVKFLTKKLGISEEEFWSNLDKRERPRVEDYDKVTMIIFKAPLNVGKVTKTISFPVYVGQDFLVSVCRDQISAVTKLHEDATRGNRIFTGIHGVLVRLLDNALAEYFNVLDYIEKEIDKLEHQAMESAEKATLESIF